MNKRRREAFFAVYWSRVLLSTRASMASYAVLLDRYDKIPAPVQFGVKCTFAALPKSDGFLPPKQNQESSHTKNVAIWTRRSAAAGCGNGHRSNRCDGAAIEAERSGLIVCRARAGETAPELWGRKKMGHCAAHLDHLPDTNLDRTIYHLTCTETWIWRAMSATVGSPNPLKV